MALNWQYDGWGKWTAQSDKRLNHIFNCLWTIDIYDNGLFCINNSDEELTANLDLQFKSLDEAKEYCEKIESNVQNNVERKFDPNKLKEKEWATYIPNRSPSFKIHASRGLATSAVKCRANYKGQGNYEIPLDVVLYKKNDMNRWIEVSFKREYRDNESIL